jgi:hypothetical protein
LKKRVATGLLLASGSLRSRAVGAGAVGAGVLLDSPESWWASWSGEVLRDRAPCEVV